jgi:membrane protease YdiL (CAAX protease family)
VNDVTTSTGSGLALIGAAAAVDAHPARAVATFVALSLGLAGVAAAGAVAGIAPALLPFVLAIGPLVIAMALATRDGRARKLFATAKQRPTRRGWYAVLLIPVAATAIVIPVAVLLGAPVAGPFDKVLPALLVVPLVVLLPAFAEELAWRGYALDRLVTVTSPAVAATLLAVPWVALHLVLFLPGQMYEGLDVWPSVVAVGSLAAITSWIYVRTGSVLLTGLVHALFNGVTPLLSGLEPAQSWQLRAIVTAVFAVVVVAVGGLRNTAQGTSPVEAR